MHYEPVTRHDLAAIRDLQPEGWPDIVNEFDFYIKKSFCHPLKAVSGHRMLGVGVSIVFGRTCWLAHIIVDKDYRKQGIGSGITAKLIRDREESAVESFLLIATEDGLPVYRKAGFRIVSEYQYLERAKPWKDVQVSPDIHPAEKKDYPAILELDRKICGENRGSLLDGHLGNAQVCKEKSLIRGFYLPGLGEGPILADTNPAGLALMKLKYPEVDKAVLPSDNIAGIGFLKRNGFVPADTKGTRMIMGNDLEWKSGGVFSRIGGNYG